MADETPTDEALIALIAQGDSEATARFYDRWFPQFARLAWRLTAGDSAGEDLAQEAVVRVIMNAGKYQPCRPARAWLVSILYHLVQDWARRQKHRRAASLGDPGDPGEGAPRGIEVESREPTVEERMHAREREAAVRAALAELPPGDRDVILLRDYAGLSGAEAARELGISVEKVGSRLYRARRRLGDILLAEWPGLFRPGL